MAYFDARLPTLTMCCQQTDNSVMLRATPNIETQCVRLPMKDRPWCRECNKLANSDNLLNSMGRLSYTVSLEGM